MSVALPLIDNDRGGTAQFGHLPGTLRSVSSATYNRAREWVPTRPRLTGLLIGVTLLATVSDLVWLRGPYAWALPGLLVLCLLAFVAVASRSRRDARASAHLSREHAALRRVATLVAEGASPRQVFEAVTSEVAQLLGLDMTTLLRFEPAGTATYLAGTGWVRDEQVRGFVTCPITIDGRIWGTFSVGSRSGPLPTDTEQRLAEFTTLIGPAIADAESRAQLAASRARLVAAADETRRRIERDLHDGVQQRLISANLTLRLTQDSVPDELPQLRSAIGNAADQLSAAVDELRETARGIHPAILTEGGLRPALRALARRSPIPVELHATPDARLPQPIEVAAYYVVSEALTNATKHAHATFVLVSLVRMDGMLRLTVRDDGVGGACPHGGGSGLLGLRDRVEALDGVIEITSTPGAGTTLRVTLPIHRCR